MKGQSVLFSSTNQNWETPRFLFNYLQRRFNITRDVAASDENHLCPLYFTEKDDALSPLTCWGGPTDTVWCNNPYDLTEEFVKKAENELVRTIFLLPARTDTRTFHEILYPNSLRIILLKGRLHFGIDGITHYDAAGFPAMVVEFSSFISAWSDFKGPVVETLDPATLPGYAEYREDISAAKYAKRILTRLRLERQDSEALPDDGRGISVCQEWLSDPVSFIEWSKRSGFQDGLTIDRIDPDGNYEPSKGGLTRNV